MIPEELIEPLRFLIIAIGVAAIIWSLNRR